MNAFASTEGFAIGISDGAGAFNVRLTGDANMNAIETLGRALSDVHARALVAGAAEVVVDLRQLEFMNSACFKKVVTWITQVEDVTPDSRYRIRFLSNSTIHWQRRSLHALQMFAIDLVSVDV